MGRKDADGAAGKRTEVIAEEMEQAMLIGQDPEDMEMIRSEQAQHAQDVAEFDESMPFLEEGDDGACESNYNGAAGTTNGGDPSDGPGGGRECFGAVSSIATQATMCRITPW